MDLACPHRLAETNVVKFCRNLLATVLLFAASACAHAGARPHYPGAIQPPAPEPVAAPRPGAASGYPGLPPLAQAVVDTALRLQGVPYRNGGSDPAGFDCSGLVQYVFAAHSIALPRSVREQYATGQPVALEEVAPGDLVFFATVSEGASHVGLAVGDSWFVHAPSGTGVVRVERLSNQYWAKRFVGARRVTAQ